MDIYILWKIFVVHDFLPNKYYNDPYGNDTFYNSVDFVSADNLPLFDLHNEYDVKIAFQHNIDTSIYKLNAVRQFAPRRIQQEKEDLESKFDQLQGN